MITATIMVEPRQFLTCPDRAAYKQHDGVVMVLVVVVVIYTVTK